MIAELLGATQSVQALATLLKSARSLANYNDIVAAVSEVNTKLMDAQIVGIKSLDEQRALHGRVHELEELLNSLRDWQQTSVDYSLQAVGALQRDFVYVYKPKTSRTKPNHWVCARCFEEKKKYVLGQTYNERAYECPNCKVQVSPIVSGGGLAPCS